MSSALMVHSSTRTAEHLRQQAAQLREMAAREPEGSEIRARLLEVAAQYDLLAERAQAGHN
jgi:hypothetical protein